MAQQNGHQRVVQLTNPLQWQVVAGRDQAGNPCVVVQLDQGQLHVDIAVDATAAEQLAGTVVEAARQARSMLIVPM